MKELSISQVQLSAVSHRRKHNHNTEPRKLKPARTRNDGRNMPGSVHTDTAQLTKCSTIQSGGMSTAASSATTYQCCFSDALHRLPEKGRPGHKAPSIQPPWKPSLRELPSSVSSSDKTQPHRGLDQVFQSDLDWRLAKLKRHKSASNVTDPTSRDSFRRSRSSRATEVLHKPRSQSFSCGSVNHQPRRGLGRVFQSDSDWKVLHKPRKLRRHQSFEPASNVPDPTSWDSFRSRSSGALELTNRPRSQSVSCGSAFDAQAIASNDLRLWVLAAKNTKLSNRRDKYRSKSLRLPAGSHEPIYSSSFVCAGTTTSKIKRCFFALVGTLYMCIHLVVLAIAGVFAACLSSDPPWAALSPGSGRAERRRPSTEDTCQWAFEALTFEYDFNV
jgi:hypothetical protein